MEEEDGGKRRIEKRQKTEGNGEKGGGTGDEEETGEKGLGRKGREGKDRRGWGDAKKAESKRRAEKGDENLTHKTLGGED